MNILINATNLKAGGGVQVGDSVCRELYKFPQHQFVVVLSSILEKCGQDILVYPNVCVVNYEQLMNLWGIVTGRDKLLDNLVEEKKIEVVLTIFGPSRWRPSVYHVCGFARPHLVIPESPYFEIINIKERIKTSIMCNILKWLFNKGGDVLYSENNFISDRLKSLYPKKKIYTITNNCNQVFDNLEAWDRSLVLPFFEGLTFLTISANYPHKNLSIILPVIRFLNEYYPDLKFRFVVTLRSDQFALINDEERKHIVFMGSVTIAQCPYLYEQSDVMFLPTLLECFSASYAEAMKMGLPILTTNLGFARSLCGDAACYYSPVSVKDLCEKIVLLATNKEFCQHLVNEGYKRLCCFDTYEARARKLIEIVESKV